MKKQKFQEGAIVKIQLSENRYAFGRLLPAHNIGIYDLVIDKSNNNEPIQIDELVSYPFIFITSIYTDVITKRMFEIIGFKPLHNDEIDKIPPIFTQDLMDKYKCKLYYINGAVEDAKPEDCIGLERFSKWEGEAVIKRIEDHYLGTKNVLVENFKVRL